MGKGLTVLTLTLNQHRKAAACAETFDRYLRLVAIPKTPGNVKLWEPMYIAWHNEALVTKYKEGE